MNKILLIEDSSSDVDFIKLSFEDKKIDIEIDDVRTAEDAISYLSSQNNPDLILLDLNLPGISGIDFLSWLKSNEYLNHIPVIVMSSSKLEEDILKSYKNYANSYIRKPMTFMDFLTAASKINEYWLQLCSLPNGDKNENKNITD